MRFVSWVTRRRLIRHRISFWLIVVLLGPPISGLSIAVLGSAIGLLFGQLPQLEIFPFLGFGSYVFGILPAAIAATVLVFLRRISFLDGLAVAFATTFACGLLYQFTFLLRMPGLELRNALSIALLSVPSVIGIAIISLRSTLFDEAAPPRASASTSP